MAEHTTGPWEFIDATKSAKYKFAPTCIIRAGDKQVASFSWNDNSPWFPTKDESQANARLIAIAPELLEVLKAFVAETVDYATINKLGDPEKQHNVKWARQVIAKATA